MRTHTPTHATDAPQNSNLKQAARDKQRKAAVTLATAMVRQYGAAIAPHVDRFQAAVLAPLRDPLLCSELISSLAQDKAALKAFLPRLLSGLLPYAKSKETSWQLLREVYETLGLIATSAGRPAASFASEILAAVLATLPRALLHVGAEGLQCCCQVMLCEGVRAPPPATLLCSRPRSLTPPAPGGGQRGERIWQSCMQTDLECPKGEV